jgi:hypothetical protein
MIGQDMLSPVAIDHRSTAAGHSPHCKDSPKTDANGPQWSQQETTGTAARYLHAPIDVLIVELLDFLFRQPSAPRYCLADLPSGRIRLRIIQDCLMQLSIANATVGLLHAKTRHFSPLWCWGHCGVF